MKLIHIGTIEDKCLFWVENEETHLSYNYISCFYPKFKDVAKTFVLKNKLSNPNSFRIFEKKYVRKIKLKKLYD